MTGEKKDGKVGLLCKSPVKLINFVYVKYFISYNLKQLTINVIILVKMF